MSASVRLHYLLRSVAVFVAVMSAWGGVSAQINTEQVLKVGRNALYFDDYMVAIGHFNRVIGAKPYLAQPYFYRAIAKVSLDDYAGAEADASAAIERNPFITDAYEVRAVARQNLGLVNEAIADYRRVLTDKPDNKSVLHNLSLALIDVSDTVAARQTVGTLLRRYPAYDGGYTIMARLNLVEGDTTAARADLDRAIELNKGATNAYVMRAELAMKCDDNIEGALADMDMAVRLSPTSPGMLINRAYLRYSSDDLRGAMEDYDNALGLDPSNAVALYNRGLLRAEVHDFNRAIADFTDVLRINPDQMRALFNRANLYRETGEWDEAYADINAVIDRFPDFAAAIYLRGEIQYHRGNRRAADADYSRSIALARKNVVMLPDSDIGEAGSAAADSAGIFSESQEAVSRRFSSLIRLDGAGSATREYSAASPTRGHIQDTEFAIRPEPLYFLTYYAQPTELKPSTDFMREADELNASRTLPCRLLVACHEPTLTDEDFAQRQQSLDYYNSYLATHTPRPVDWFARGMDLMSLRDYAGAAADFSKAAEADGRFAAALLMRAVARWKEMLAADTQGTDAMLGRATAETVVTDLDAVTALSPSMAVAWYDKGCVLAHLRRYSEAIDPLTRAIELQPEMGEAWFNRGYVNMMLGNKAAAFTDLSRAGQLGVAPAYNLLKRMSM